MRDQLHVLPNGTLTVVTVNDDGTPIEPVVSEPIPAPEPEPEPKAKRKPRKGLTD